MVIDTKNILERLIAFYDFRNKIIISVGSDELPLVGYGRIAKKVVAINNIPEASECLRDIVRHNYLENKYIIINGDYPSMDINGDVILFEFSLHKMSNPSEVLIKSLHQATDIIVLDHWTDSEWIYYTGEEEKISEEWRAIRSLSPVKSKSHACLQLFPKYEDLENKLKQYHAIPQERINFLKDAANIMIVMSYNIALLSRNILLKK